MMYPPPNLLCPLHTFVLLHPLAAAAGGDMTARRATATGGTNTRRARGARRAKRPARTSAQTKRTRRPWSSDHHLLPPPPPSSPLVRLSVSTRPLRVSSHHDKDTKGEAGKTRKVQSDRCVLSLLRPSISILLCPAVVYPHLDFRQRMDGVEEVVMEGRSCLLLPR